MEVVAQPKSSGVWPRTKTCLSLMESPAGTHIQERLNPGVREYPQIRSKPCRIIYRVLTNSVYILDPYSFRQLFR